MIIEHHGQRPQIDPAAYIAPNAVICGNVTIGAGCRIMFGACVAAEAQPIVLGENCIVMENAVLRSTDQHPLTIGSGCLIGPHAHIVGCTLADCVFIATGASIFHGASLGYGSEVRINGVVHLRTELPAHTSVPIGWIAVGNPAQLFPPDRHDAIWALQQPLNFPKFVYGVERSSDGESIMPEITRRRSEALSNHFNDVILDK